MRIVGDYKEFIKKGGFAKKTSTILLNPCFHAVCLYRLASTLHKLHFTLIAKVIWYINRLLFNVDIDYRADLAGGFVIVHGLGVVIGKDVISKGKLTVYQGVTIGGSGKCRVVDGNEIWQPILGSNVCIYTQAMILGPVLVKDNAIIKAGERITKDC